MDDRLQKVPSGLGEAALWLLATVFLTGLALAAMGTARLFLDWNDSQWIAASVGVSLLSATWGTWAALTWTHSRILRALMLVLTLVPGALIMALGIWAFFHVPENRWIWRWGWVIFAGHGAGAVVMALLVGGRGLFRRSPLWLRSRRLAIGWTLYPLLIGAASVAVVAMVFSFIPELISGGDSSIELLVRWIVPSQALVLLTTGLPAGCAQICRALTGVREVR